MLTLWLASGAAATTNLEGEVELLGGVSFTHHFVTAGDAHWHYVEAGDPNAEPVVFIAGLPESWYSFHPQLIELAPAHRVISLEIFGQTVRPDTASFLTEDIAADIIAWADAIGLGRFNLVTHDWGTMVGHRVAGLYPERVLRFARMEAP
jgi:pimeloyl-ACP methyl ester carboxylesterase